MIRRGLLALSVSIVALSALAPVASADDDVLLVVNGASPIRIDGEHILNEGDIGSDAARFTVRNADLSIDKPIEPGASITALLGFVGMSPLSLVDSGAAVQVDFGSSRPGQAVPLSRSDVIDGFPNDPLEGRRDAVIGLSYGSLHFLRPVRSESDRNGIDRFNVPKHDDLTVRIVTTGKQLHVEASALPQKIDPGGSVQFHAGVTNLEPGVTYTYTWDFDDGSPQVNDPNPQHAYAGDVSRTAQPKVTVVGIQDGSSGSGNVGTIQVGEPATGTPTPTPTATASATAAPKTTGGGGGRSGGGEGGRKDRATGPSRSKGKENTRKRGSKQGAATATPAPAGTATATATAAPTVSATATATATPASNDPAASPGSPDQDEEPPLANETSATSPPGGERVEGILLASSGSLAEIIDAAKSAEKQQEQDRSQARHGGGGSASVAGWVGGGAGLVALLALGALLEGGIPRRRLSVR